MTDQNVAPVSPEEREEVLRRLISAAGKIAGVGYCDDGEAPPTWLIPMTWVAGQPRPQGSKKPFLGKKAGGGQFAGMKESSPHVGGWRSDVRSDVQKVHPGDPLNVPVEVSVTFVFRRPNSHYIAGKRERGLRPDAPTWCTSHAVGDVDKLQRAIGDALEGVAWSDDCLIVRWHDPAKLWGDHAGMWITYRELAP